MSSIARGSLPVLDLACFDAAVADVLVGRCRAALSVLDGVVAARWAAQGQAGVEWRGRFADEFDGRRDVDDSGARAVAEEISALLRRLGAAESAARAENQRRALAHRRAVESWEAEKLAAEQAVSTL